MKFKLIIVISVFLFVNTIKINAQAIPAKNENIPFLVTFGKNAEKAWGDDDHNQIIFFSIPKDQKTPFYIRVYDPDTGGKHDESKTGFNTTTKFSLYGAGCFSSKDVENKDPVGNYKNGNLINTKSFAGQPIYDDKWYTFGPINPLEGELLPELGGYIFKMVIEGVSGDDGNLYRLFMSVKSKENVPIEGGNAFMYEYSFRINTAKQISHLYPYIDQYTTAVKQHNFDFDNDAYIKLISMSQPGVRVKTSADGVWGNSIHEMQEKDKKTCLDLQIVKTGARTNNNVVFYITNQRGKFMQFHSIPIGAIPKKKIGIRPGKR